MASIEIKSSNNDEVQMIMKGRFDEETVFPTQQFKLSQRIILDCANIDHINSHGIQVWIIWMRSHDPRQQYVFRQVPQRLLDVVNMVDGFLSPHAIIESFYLPYECLKCGHEENLLLHRGKDYLEADKDRPEKLLLSPAINCAMCKSAMRISVLEDKYFLFLRRKSKANSAVKKNANK